MTCSKVIQLGCSRDLGSVYGGREGGSQQGHRIPKSPKSPSRPSTPESPGFLVFNEAAYGPPSPSSRSKGTRMGAASSDRGKAKTQERGLSTSPCGGRTGVQGLGPVLF